MLKNVDVGPQKDTLKRRNYLRRLVSRVTTQIADMRANFASNELIKQTHKDYEEKKKAILTEKELLERAHKKLVSLHRDATKEHCRKPSNVKVYFTGVEHPLNDLSKDDDPYKIDEKRKETNDFLATMLSGFLQASSGHLPSSDPPRPRSPKYETLLKYKFYFYFFITVCHNPNINFF